MTDQTPIRAAAGATVSRADLRAALAAIRPLRLHVQAAPALTCLRLSIRPAGTLRLEATDLDTWVRADIEASRATGDSTRQAMIPARWMDRAATAAGNTLRIEIAADTVAVASDGLTLRLRTLCPPSDFPAAPRGPEWLAQHAGTLPAGAWRAALDDVRATISTDTARYYLNGACLDRHDGAALLVSTDGHRLSRRRIDLPAPDGDAPSLIIPTGAVDALRATFRRGDNRDVRLLTMRPVAAVGAPTAMRWEMADMTLTAKLLDGKFPDWRRILPPAEARALDLRLSGAALRRAAGIARLMGLSPALALEPGATVATVTHDDSTLTIPVEGTCPHRIGFNLRYLAGAARGEDVLRLRGPGEGPTFAEGADPALQRVIMPMRV